MRPLILIADDNSNDFRFLERAFSKGRKSCTMLWFKNGEQAAQYLMNESNVLPELVISDLKMPRMDGLDLLKLVRRNPNTKHIPFIILSSSSLERDRSEAERIGATRFWVKPIKSEELRRMTEVLHRFVMRSTALKNRRHRS